MTSQIAISALPEMAISVFGHDNVELAIWCIISLFIAQKRDLDISAIAKTYIFNH